MKKIILPAILSIVLCISLITGATFALFTSEDTLNVSVTAGNVEMKATVEAITYTSTLGTVLNESSATYNNASTNELTLDKMVPGDVVTFQIVVKNLSDVTVKYRTVLKAADDTGLWDGLVVTIDGVTYDGTAIESAWGTLAPTTNDVTVINVSITLPESAGNEYKSTSCKIVYFVEAYQGNVDTSNL